MEEKNRGIRWAVSCKDQERYMVHVVRFEFFCFIEMPFGTLTSTNFITDTNCLVVSGVMDDKHAEMKKAR